MTALGYWLARVPVGMHFGWITAAAVLSWNNQLAAAGVAAALRLTAAIASCYAAFAALAAAAAAARDPVPALVAAWALTAVSQVRRRRRALRTRGWGGDGVLP